MAVDRDQSLVPLLERALVHPRLVVEAVAKGVGTQLHEVPPAAEIEREQDEVEPTVGDTGPRAVPTIAGLALPIRSDVGLDPENRLDPRRPGGGMELERRVEVAVIGDRDRGHAERLHALDELLDPVAAVEQGVLAVEMEVDETVGGDRRRVGGGFRLFSCTRLGHQLSIRGRRGHGRRVRAGSTRRLDDRTAIHGIAGSRPSGRPPRRPASYHVRMSEQTPFNRPPFVRVIGIGQQMGDGFRRIDRGGPFSRLLAGIAAVVLAVPILVIGVILLLTLFAFAIAAALVSLVLGRRPGMRSAGVRPAGGPESAGRENVRVIPAHTRVTAPPDDRPAMSYSASHHSRIARATGPGSPSPIVSRSTPTTGITPQLELVSRISSAASTASMSIIFRWTAGPRRRPDRGPPPGRRRAGPATEGRPPVPRLGRSASRVRRPSPGSRCSRSRPRGGSRP